MCDDNCCSLGSVDLSKELVTTDIISVYDISKTSRKLVKSNKLKYSYHVDFDSISDILNTNQTVQVFLNGSINKRYTPPIIKPSMINNINSYLVNDKSLIIHAPLNLNLAKVNSSINLLTRYTSYSNKFNNSTVVAHMGSNPDKQEGINIMTRSLNNYVNSGIIKNTKRKPLLLEVSAGQGNTIGASYKELRKIKEALDNSTIGLCLDTQHCFAASICDGSYNGISLMMEAFKDLDFLPEVIHLNDSCNDLGCNVDRHSPLCNGYIWNDNKDGIVKIIEYAQEYNIELITETSDNLSDMEIIKECSLLIDSL